VQIRDRSAAGPHHALTWLHVDHHDPQVECRAMIDRRLGKPTFDMHSLQAKRVDDRLDVGSFLVAPHAQRVVQARIICSDHGTAYGEDGYWGHRVSHPVVWDVPYAEFILSPEDGHGP
jgi:hypothetical protein